MSNMISFTQFRHVYEVQKYKINRSVLISHSEGQDEIRELFGLGTVVFYTNS